MESLPKNVKYLQNKNSKLETEILTFRHGVDNGRAWVNNMRDQVLDEKVKKEILEEVTKLKAAINDEVKFELDTHELEEKVGDIEGSIYSLKNDMKNWEQKSKTENLKLLVFYFKRILRSHTVGILCATHAHGTGECIGQYPHYLLF